MQDKNKTKQQLIDELDTVRLKVADLEQSVAEYKKAAEALRESKNRYHELVQNANSIILRMDTQGHITFLNEFAQHFFGYTEQEILGKNAVGTIVPRLESTNRNLEDMIRDIGKHPERYTNNENENIRKNGERVWIAWTNKAVYDPAGNIREILCIGNDITERKKTSDELQRILAVLQAAIEQSPAGIIIADAPQGRIRMANPAALGIRGKTDKPLTGIDISQHSHSWQPFLPDGSPVQPQDLPLSRAVQKGEISENVELILRQENGTMRWVSCNATPVHDNRDSLIAGIVIFHDITERKEAENEIKTSKDLLENIFKTSLDGLIVSDASGYITMVNDTIEMIFGYSRDELIGQHVTMLGGKTPEQQARGRKIVETFFEQGYVECAEDQWVKKDGGLVDIEMNMVLLLNAEGEASGVVAGFRDITQRKQVEKERERLINILEATSDFVATATPDAGLTYLNAAAKKMMGMDREEPLAGKRIPDLHPRWAVDLILGTGVPAAIEKGIWTGETAVLHRSGREIPVSQVIMSHKSADNNVEYLSTIIRDISDRKRAEEALKSSERNYREIFNASGDAIFIHDIHTGKILDVNQTVCNMFGYSYYEALQLDVGTLSLGEPPYSQAQSEERIRKASLSGPQTFEWLCRKKKGDLFWSEITLKRAVIGGLDRMLAFVRDITERKQTEAERLRLATAMDQAEESIFITDTQGIIEYVNPAFERITGLGLDDIRGRHTSMLQSDRNPRSQHEDMMEHVTAGKVWKGHLFLPHTDGHVTEVEANYSPIKNEDGHISNYVAVHRDVTQEVSMEKQLRQSQKMEAIGTLAGGIAHDFNNILAAVIGYTELSLSMKIDNEKINHNLSQVLKAGHRAKDLVNQILAFSRRTEQERKPVMVIPIVKEMTKFLRASLPTTIEIHQHIQAKSDIVLADPTQIHQVLMNLCTNAGHAMKEKGGVLEISVTDCSITAEQLAVFPDLKPGPHVKMSISDSGHGIPPDVLDHIFEPYYTTKKKGEGTGLGLAVVHGIIQSYQGLIKAFSEEGKGSRFDVYLPIEDIGEVPAAEESELLPTGSEKVLIVDDEPFIADIIQQTLASLGYDAVGFTSPSEALQAFQQEPHSYDLLITDKTMPDMTGFELAQAIATIREDVPVIMCTGYAEKEDAERIQGSGIREFIMKPPAKKELAVKIRNIFGGQKQPH